MLTGSKFFANIGETFKHSPARLLRRVNTKMLKIIPSWLVPEGIFLSLKSVRRKKCLKKKQG